MRNLTLTSTLFAFLISNPVSAKAEDYDASSMWGTAPAGTTVKGALDSSVMHVQNGVIAGQVNAAKAGLLFSNGDDFNITSIGSQSVINNTIQGDDNIISVHANQTSSNSGSVSSNGQVSAGE